jgi:hypothetical protein
MIYSHQDQHLHPWLPQLQPLHCTCFPHAHMHVCTPPAAANWQHLSGNMFNLTVFGRLVEETEGAAGLLLAYAITAAGVPCFCPFCEVTAPLPLLLRG